MPFSVWRGLCRVLWRVKRISARKSKKFSEA
ncbi:hypothetical protein SAMN06265373_104228 [Shimia sagamensis]|uniref:Uncharacterized protein n=1 Tax=Shimia sagamensis TaxID=1566352 RepID=A0ABY1NZZ4_9RHOB|nr:hypothetical protein SAMN06265373_104228 [Shimia sagamensis]